MADMLAVLYGKFLRFDPRSPDWPERDRFILSKGHGCAALYAVLAECGYFPVADLETFYQDGSPLAGHATHKGVPGVEVSTGSLGHGLPIGTGMALAAQARRQGTPDLVHAERRRVRRGLDLGGGALRAAPPARQPGRDRGLQQDPELRHASKTSSTSSRSPRSGGRSAGACARSTATTSTRSKSAYAAVPFEPGRPSCIVAHTVKGKGVSFMEDKLLWHYRAPRGEDLEIALARAARQRGR